MLYSCTVPSQSLWIWYGLFIVYTGHFTIFVQYLSWCIHRKFLLSQSKACVENRRQNSISMCTSEIWGMDTQNGHIWSKRVPFAKSIMWNVRMKTKPTKTRMTLRPYTSNWYVLDVAPSQDSSDHQDYYIFRIGDPNLNLHLPLLLGGGHTQDMYTTTKILQIIGNLTGTGAEPRTVTLTWG